MPVGENALYREALLEHVRHPRNRGALASPDLRASVQNPLCGDELEVTVNLDGEKIVEIKVQVRACSFAQASSSLMSVLVNGIALDEVLSYWRKFKDAMENASEQLPVELDALSPLLVVNKLRSRVGCVLLPWEALINCIDEHQKISQGEIQRAFI